jgi:ferredoxin-type protein NapH
MNKGFHWKQGIISVLLTLPLLYGSFYIVGMYKYAKMTTDQKIAYLFFYIMLNGLFFLTMYTKKIDKFRAVMFISIAIAFPLEFILGLYEQRGHFMIFTFSDMINGVVPFCHIVIPQTIIPMIFTKQVLFPGLISKFTYSIGFMVVTWLAVSLLVGKAWCSWACFFGGWEDGCSRITRKARVKLNPKMIWSSFAVFILVILTSIEFATPTYCIFLCPFKACSEFAEVSTPLVIIQTIIFAVLFSGLVIILPMLTKKRTQCITLCPFGAFQALVDRINPFCIRIDTDNCANCKKCMNACPVMSISEKSIQKGSVGPTCVKCGKCIDICPKKCMHFHIKGAPKNNVLGKIARQIFLYLTYTILAGMGSYFIISFLERILLLIRTGSILK